MNYETIDSCQVHGLNEIYLKYFGYKTDGTFIEVGACDGVRWSNTYGLYRAGWGGCMYEPDPFSFAKCIENMKGYSNVSVWPYAVGDKVCEIELHIGNIGASTISKDFLLAAKIGGWEQQFQTIKKVQMITLDTIFLQNGLKQNQVDVISIDTEGNEPDVLRGFTISKWMPNMVIIEAHEHYPGNDRPKTHEFINKYFEDNNYKKIYCDEVNNIYVPNTLD